MLWCACWQAMKARQWDDFKEILQKYKMIQPKDAESTAVMGGVWVLDEGTVSTGGRGISKGPTPMKQARAR